MKIWVFELKKMWRRKQFLILALLAVVCVMILFLRNFWGQDEIVNRAVQSIATHSQSVYKIENQFREEMVLRSEEATSDTEFMKAVDNSSTMSIEIRNWQEAIRNNKWESVPASEMALIQTVFNHIEWGGSYDGYAKDGLYQSFEKNKVLLELSLPFEDDLYSITPPNFMKIVFTYIVSIPALGLLVVLLGDQLVIEKERHTIRTLSTQPIHKWWLLVGKFMSQLSAIVFMLLIITVTCLVIPFLFGVQQGSFSYPHLIHLSDGFDFITIGHYLLLHSFLFVGMFSLLCSFILLYSTFVKDRLSVIVFTLLTLFGGLVLTKQFSALQSAVNPFYYVRFQELIEQPHLLGNPLLIAVPYCYALFIVFISSTVLKMKDTTENGKKEMQPFKKGAVLKTIHPFFYAVTFEWRKFKREGIVKRFTIITLLLIVGGYAFIAFSTNQLREQYITNKNSTLESSKEIISAFEQTIKGGQGILEKLAEKGSTLTSSEERQKEIAQSQVDGFGDAVSAQMKRIEQQEKELFAYEQGDWKTIHESWIGEIMLWWKDPHYGDNMPTERGGLSDFTYMASVQENEWMIEHNLATIHNSNPYRLYTWTIYDKFISPLEQLKWNQDTRKVDKTGLFYIYTFFTTYGYFILIGLLLLLFGAGMTAEKGVKRTLTFLQTQPLTKSAIFLGKTSISMLLAVGIALLSIVCMVLLGTVSDRFGDWKFPVLYYDLPSVVDSESYTGFLAEEGGFHFIYMGNFLLETGALFLAGLVFLIALSLAVSLFFNNAMGALLTTLILAVGGYVASSLPVFASIAHWSPFTYLNVGKIANGEMAIVLGNESVSTMPGLAALLIGTVLLVGAGTLWFRSKWMKVV